MVRGLAVGEKWDGGGVAPLAVKDQVALDGAYRQLVALRRFGRLDWYRACAHLQMEAENENTKS
jgi:hypothetical protein